MHQVQGAKPLYPLSKKLLALSFAILFASGCTTVPQNGRIIPPEGATTPPPIIDLNNTLAAVALQEASTPSADYRLGPEDLLEIILFNVPPTEVGVTPRTTEARVSQQGTITVPLLGDIPAAGRTTVDIEHTLEERYATYLRNPAVGVVVKEYHSQRVSVIGAVKNPGVFKLTGPKTFIDLFAMAGGVSEKAGRQVHLYRQGTHGRESHIFDLYSLLRNPTTDPADLAKLTVQSGDIINVPEAGMFFVDGAVKSPGSFAMNRPYTLTQALSAAGGVNFELAKTNGISILRRQGATEIATVAVNLSEIQAGVAPDPSIEADDVILVPVSGVKYFVRRFVGSIVSGFSISTFMY